MSEFEKQFNDINAEFNELLYNLDNMSVEKNLEKKVYSDDGRFLGITASELVPEPYSTLLLKGCLKISEDKIVVVGKSLKNIAETYPDEFKKIADQLKRKKIGLTQTSDGVAFLVMQEPLFESYEDRLFRTNMESINTKRNVSADSDIYDESNNKTNIKIGEIPDQLREKLSKMKLLVISNYGNIVLKVSEIKSLASEKPEIYGEIINTLRAEGIDVTIFEVEKLSNLTRNNQGYGEKADTGYIRATNINPSPAYKVSGVPSGVHNLKINKDAVEKLSNKTFSLINWIKERLKAIGLTLAIMGLVVAVGASLSQASDVDAIAATGNKTSISESEEEYSKKINMLFEDDKWLPLINAFVGEVAEDYADAVRRFQEQYDSGLEAYKRECGIAEFEQNLLELYLCEDKLSGDYQNDFGEIEDTTTLKKDYKYALYKLVKIAEENGDKFGEGKYAIYATATVVDGKVYYEIDLSKLENGVLPEGSKIVDGRLYCPNLDYAIEETPGAPKF